jgi:uncharacterized membrane protein YcaP (DUF421 family)
MRHRQVGILSGHNYLVAMPTILIYDGKIEGKNLHDMGLDYEWLTGKLMEKGIIDSKVVF